MFDVSEPLALHQGDKIMLCSDGLWGVLDEIQIVRVLASQPVSDAAPDLVEMALRRRRRAQRQRDRYRARVGDRADARGDRGVSTDSISDGVFASTIQAGMPADGEVDDLDDDAIERSIAEINDAIQRSARNAGGRSKA